MQPNSESVTFGKESFVLSTGKLAKQANGAVTVAYGGTVVLVTACISKNIREGQDFFPLTVDYQEKTYAAGKIPGGFFKREGRPSESEILTCRLIDRPIRPLFPKGMLNEVQIIAVVLSSDGENDPDVMAVNAASAALSISDIPFNGPAACCRVARVNSELILNPTYAQRDAADLDVIVVAGDHGICMLESKAKEVSEEDYLKAVKFGHDALKDILAFQKEFAQKYGRAKITDAVYAIPDEALQQKVESLSRDRLLKIYKMGTKEEREDNVAVLLKEIVDALASEEFTGNAIKAAFLEVEEALVRKMILEDNVRVDGRGFKDIRPISCEVSFLPRTHGSALFTRGQTQSLAITTLGTGDDEQMIEALEGEQYKTFMLHYNFPPFSVGETGRMSGAGRREIGHGALAEKALAAVMPTKEQFPYTVRVVSEILESNGSSSMATVCAGCLSLMDAGVPIKEPISGIALGFIKGKNKSIVLTDIAGVEDHFGDMDLKVAGSKNGVTAVQMDLKIDGITLSELTDCLAQAREARMTILGKMTAVLQQPRGAISTYAPRIEKIKINTEKIGAVIGPGGKTIKAIIAATGATIDISDDGTVLIASNDNAKSQAAIAMVKAITEDVEVGRIYPGKVKRVTNFGAFCEIAPGKEGLVHVSELSNEFVKDVASVVKVGDEFKVKVVAIDEMGRINLSKKRAEEPTQK